MIYLHTLGELRLEGSQGPPLSSPRKELTLLAYLARRAPRVATRPELAALLWDARDEGRARKSLRQALFELKRTLGQALVLEPDRVGLDPGLLAWDIGDFERALEAGDFAQAAARWNGDFLAGAEDQGGEEFRGWLEVEREHLRQRLRGAFEQLIGEARRRGAWTEGVSRARRWVELLPSDVKGHQELIELLDLDGRAEEALAHHAAFRTRFHSEFGVQPPASFLELSKRLERNAASGAARLPTSAALFTPDLIGRGAALAELLTAWSSTKAGAPVGILVEGEAGIGKTRLCEEFLARIREDKGCVILEGRVQESEPGPPLTLLRRVLEGLATAPGLAGAPSFALAELARHSPTLAERFPGLVPADDAGTPVDDALAQSLDAVAQEQPVVLYVDDLMWADRASQRTLVGLAGRLRSPVFLLISARTGEPEPQPEVLALASLPAMRRLKLQPLSLAGVEALLGSMMRLDSAQRHALARRLHAQGGGNPFFTIELTAAMVDDGLLLPTESGPWQLEAEGGEALPLPASIRDVVGRRLARVSPSARGAAEGAAVLGRSFSPELIPLVTRRSPPETAVALEELIARKLVRESRSSPGMYEFTHEITWRVTYDLLSGDTRAALHLAAARAWDSRSRRNPAALTAAEYHRGRAGSPPRLQWWRRRRVLVPALVASALALGLVATMVRSRSRHAPVPLMANRLAVFPFSVQGPEQYAYLREGLPTLLSVALDGIDSLRSVDPKSVQRMMSSEGVTVVDPVLARSLAGRVGAQLYILGEVVGSGSRIRIVASAYGPGDEEPLAARAMTEGDGEDVLRLADALSRQLLAARKPAAAASLTKTAALTTSSLEAFKFYLTGERALRGRRKSESIQAFLRATELDSGFALAHYQLAVSERINGRPDSALVRARRALAVGNRLPERHRMLLGAIVAALTGAADKAEALYRNVVEDDPENLEAWYMLGELLQHGNPWRGRSMAESKPVFERMLVLAPGDDRAVWHLARVAGTQGDSARLRSLLDQVDSSSGDAYRARMVHAFAFGGEREQTGVLAELRTRNRSGVVAAVQEIVVLTKNLGGAERAARLLLEPGLPRHTRAAGFVLTAALQAAQGRWRHAAESLRAADLLDPAQALVAMGFFSTQPLLPLSRADLVDTRRRLLAGLPRSGYGDSQFRDRYAYLQPYLLGLLDARLDDLSSLPAYAANLNQRRTDSVAPMLGRELRAILLHADSGAAAALSQLSVGDLQEWRVPVPFSLAFAPSGYERFLRAEWLGELGQDDEAHAWYAGLEQEDLQGLIYVAPSHARRAELYYRKGDWDRARTHYQRFIHWWREADPELQPLVDSATARLATLPR